jgi:alcohol dehydrogenase class IV
MWYFVSPQLVFGEGALDALAELGVRRAFVVTDAGLAKLGLVERVSALLRRAGADVCVFDAVESEPSVATVQQGAEAARAYAPDWIVGLGGGSAMDAAKTIWALYVRPDLQPEEINPIVPLGVRGRQDGAPVPRLLTIPTTSGTGAEVTWGIVLTDTAAQRKMGLGNRENLADVAIIDPALASAMPPALTAATGLDALTHAIEGYTCTWHTDLTDGLCLQAARLVMAFLPRAVRDGSDAVARERMHNAATCAGLGFGNAMASLAHAMGHALGAVFHLPHGQAVGLCLPLTIEFAACTVPARYADLAAILGSTVSDEKMAARDLALRVRHLIRAVGQPLSVAEAGVSPAAYEAALEKLVDDAFNDTQILTVAREPSYEELQRLYRYAFTGQTVDF